MAAARSRLVFCNSQNLLFNGVPRNQPVGEDLSRLADAVRAVDGLRFHRRIPPGIEKEHVLGGGEVQAQAAGFQADQEKPAIRVVLEAFHARLPIARGAVQILVDNALVQALAYYPEQR